MLDIVRRRKWFYLLTALLAVVTVVALTVPPRLPWGLEFSSGSSLDLEFTQADRVEVESLRAQLNTLGIEKAVIQRTGENAFFIRLQRVEDELVPILQERFGELEAADFRGPTDMAMTVTFPQIVSVEELRAGFGEETLGVVIAKAGENLFFVAAPGVAGDRLAATLQSYRQRFGPLEEDSLEPSQDLVVYLDFGPSVEADALRAEVAAHEEGVSVETTGEGSFFITGVSVPTERQQALIAALEEQFGLARRTTLDGPTDMALRLSFPQEVSIADLRAELARLGFAGLVVTSLGEEAFFVGGKGIPSTSQEILLSGLEGPFGEVQRAAFDLSENMAVNLDFGPAVELGALRAEALRLGREGVVIEATGQHTFFLAGRGIPTEQQEPFVAALEGRLGLARQTPFDFAGDSALMVQFTDLVSLDQALNALAAVPIADALRGRATAQSVGDSTFFLFSGSASSEQRQAILADLEGRFGAQVTTAFDGLDDMALTLDFGPPVLVSDLQSEASRQGLSGLTVEAREGNKFLLVGQGIASENQDVLLSALEQRLGPAARSSFDAPGDMALLLKFEGPTSIVDLRAEVANQGDPDAAVVAAGEDAFFLGEKGVSPETQDALVAALEQRFGALQRTPFDFSSGMALTLDFGPAVTVEELRDEVKDLGFEGVVLSPAGGTAFFLGRDELPTDQQDALVSALEEQFGLASRAPFDLSSGMALSVRFVESAKLAQAVTDLMIVQKTGASSFFLAGREAPAARQEQVLSALRDGIGPAVRENFDFTRGTALEAQFPLPVTADQIRAVLEPFRYTDLAVEPQGSNDFFIRAVDPQEDQKAKIVRTLEERFGPVNQENLEFSFVDPEIARRSVLNTFWAVLAATVGILLYVWWAFRRIPRPFRFGVAAIIALVHDVLMVLGAFGVMAKFRPVEIDSLMIIGLLAVIGYSVNNTIVVFDRIRENVARSVGRGFDLSVNISLNETLSRNLSTSVTTSLAILAVLLFGGPTIRDFMLVLLVGVLAGTYSSLFLAANFLVSWELGEIPRPRLPFLRRRAIATR